jgi:hypothetical protein
MDHPLAGISRTGAKSVVSRQSQHTTQEERIPSGIVGARIRQLQTLGKSDNKSVDDQITDATAERERENIRLG